MERKGQRYEVWQVSTTPEGKRLVRRVHTAPTVGQARAAARAISSRLPADELVIQDRVRRHWFKS